STGLYVVVSGRLQVVRENANGTAVIIAEAGPGEAVGEMGFFTKEPRSASVIAIRDSLLLRFPNAAFERIVARHPEVVRDLTRMMSRGAQRTSSASASAAKSVAIVPLRMMSPLADFIAQLMPPLGADLH